MSKAVKITAIRADILRTALVYHSSLESGQEWQCKYVLLLCSANMVIGYIDIWNFIQVISSI